MVWNKWNSNESKFSQEYDLTTAVSDSNFTKDLFDEIISTDEDTEIFIRVDWKSYVQDQSDGYWEKGMTSVPMVAYQLSDQSTHKKVREHFGYKN